MGIALNRLAKEDPSFRYNRDDETGQTTIEGMGELHLDIIVDRMKREFKVDCSVGEPQVSYREAVTQTAIVEYVHKKQSGGAGQFAKVKISFSPSTLENDKNSVGSVLEFVSELKGGAIPKEYIPAVQKGIESVLSNGAVAGFPVVGLKAVLLDGGFHDVDSSALAFEIAGRAAAREGLKRCKSRLKEPIMKVDVQVPEDYLGDVIGDINARRGQIIELGERGAARTVSSIVPLANMFQYVSTIRSMSKGRAQYSMELKSYEFVPPHIEKELALKFKSQSVVDSDSS